jgi:hypothetical protein
MANTTGKKFGGREKGTPNKLTKELKDMIRQALEDAGGIEYLVKQANENPNAFLSLVGKLVPLQLSGEVNHNYVMRAPAPAQNVEQWQQQHNQVTIQ